MKTTFKAYEERNAQQQEIIEKQRKRQNMIEEAQAELAAAKAEHSALVQQYANDPSLDEELDKADEKVSAANKKLERLKHVYHIDGRSNIGLEELKKGWNEQFSPEYFEKEMKPHLDKIAEAKAAYLEGLEAYKKARRELGSFREEVAASVGKQFPYDFYYPEVDHSKYYLDYTQLRHEDRY